MTISRELAEFATGYGAGSFAVGRNRIINGAMEIDQRNAGASVTVPGNSTTYTADRWNAYATQASKFTVQQTPSATETDYATRVGAGFTNYLACTSSASTSVGASDYYVINQRVEGLNVSDLAWGTSNAKTITLSAWVYSSLTGTFGGAIQNSAQNRSYPFSFTISAANTWTQISITIAGDTSGTWLTTNGIGMRVFFSLGSGSSYSGTSGAWAGTAYFAPTSAVQPIATSGATFYITGVQLEEGTVATPFERRMYGQELALCQRYFQKLTYAGNGVITVGVSSSTTSAASRIDFLQEMRSAPTVTLPPAGKTAGTISFLNQSSYPSVTGSNSAAAIDTQGFRLDGSGYTGLGGNGQASWLYPTSTAVSFAVDAEL